MTHPPPRKRFGQHFLEPAWVEKLLRTIAPAPADSFLEIGPGRGAMTRPLAAHAGRVVAVEIDRDLASALAADAAPNLTVVDADFLDITAERLRSLFDASQRNGPIRVAGNLPYNVAAPILFKLAELYAAGVPLADAHVMLQKEVADRLTASAGTGDYSVLTVLMRHTASVRRVMLLPPGAFRPAPAVQSAVVRLEFHPPDPPVRSAEVFSDLVRAVFTRRRKTLANALLAYGAASGGRVSPLSRESIAALFDRAAIDGSRRPETLGIAEFARLADLLAGGFLPAPPRAVL